MKKYIKRARSIIQKYLSKLWVRISLAISGLLLLIIFVGVSLIIITTLIDPDILREEFEEDSQEYGLNDGDIDFFHEFSERTTGIIGVSLVIGLVSGVMMSRFITKPISELADGTKILGSGNLNHRFEPKGGEELGSLALALNKMAEDLQEAERLRSNMVADISHELRTPLTVLEGNLRAAIDDVYQLDKPEIANLYQQTRHLIRLVNDLHELAQAEAHQLPLYKENVDINELLKEVVAVFDPLAQEKLVQLKLVSDASLPSIEVDPGRIRQVLHNLVSNALRYTQADDTISLITSIQDENWLQIQVRDTGQGIEPQYLPQLFNRFYRPDASRSRETGGTGLGLAIVKAIIEAHGGSVTADSNGLGHGATFTILLPLHAD